MRHRAKLVGLRSNVKCQVHAVLAGAGVQVPMSDLFGVGGQRLLAAAGLTVESRSRVDSLLRIITVLEVEIDVYTAPTEAAAMERFLEFCEAWGERYPAIVRLWENAWAEFVPFLGFGARCRIGAPRESIFTGREDGQRGPLVSPRSAGPAVPDAAGHARVAA